MAHHELFRNVSFKLSPVWPRSISADILKPVFQTRPAIFSNCPRNPYFSTFFRSTSWFMVSKSFWRSRKQTCPDDFSSFFRMILMIALVASVHDMMALNPSRDKCSRSFFSHKFLICFFINFWNILLTGLFKLTSLQFSSREFFCLLQDLVQIWLHLNILSGYVSSPTPLIKAFSTNFSIILEQHFRIPILMPSSPLLFFFFASRKSFVKSETSLWLTTIHAA